jgi:ABC-2 type transport system ATP-binding protein
VAIIDHGRIIALDTPKRLVAAADVEQSIAFVIEGSLDVTRLEALPGAIRVLSDGHGEFTLFAREAHPVLKSLIEMSETNGFKLRGLEVAGATLEDVFIRLTGRRIRA